VLSVLSPFQFCELKGGVAALKAAAISGGSINRENSYGDIKEQ
jgi:hypothetical protein